MKAQSTFSSSSCRLPRGSRLTVLQLLMKTVHSYLHGIPLWTFWKKRFFPPRNPYVYTVCQTFISTNKWMKSTSEIKLAWSKATGWEAIQQVERCWVNFYFVSAFHGLILFHSSICLLAPQTPTSPHTSVLQRILKTPDQFCEYLQTDRHRWTHLHNSSGIVRIHGGMSIFSSFVDINCNDYISVALTKCLWTYLKTSCLL